MEKNNNVRNLKIKIISLAISFTIMACFFGVVVYSLLTQSLQINNQITVSDKGQAKSIVKIYEYLGPNNSTYQQLTSEPNMTLAFEKNKDEDFKEGDFLNQPVFGGLNSYRYFLIKLEIENQSSVNVNYSFDLKNSLGEKFVISSQLEYKYLENLGENFSLSECDNFGALSVGESVSKYLVISMKDGIDFDQLIETGSHDFYLTVEVSAVAD